MARSKKSSPVAGPTEQPRHTIIHTPAETAGADTASPERAIEERIQGLIGQLNHAAKDVRFAAADALAAVGLAAVPYLVDALAHPDPIARRNAIAALSRIHSCDPTQVVPALSARLGDDDAGVRRNAAWALFWMHGPPTEGTEKAYAQALVEAFALRDESVRSNPLMALARLAPAEVVVPMFVEALGDDDGAVRAEAARALRTIGARAAAAVPALAARLGDEEAVVRAEAAFALGSIGAPAAAAAPALAARLGDEEVAVREEAAMALGSIGAPAAAAVPALAAWLGDEEAAVRAEAAKVLSSIGAPAAAAVPALAARLGDNDAAVRRHVADALRKIREQTDVAVIELRRRLGNSDPRAQINEVLALVRMGAAAVPELCQVLWDRNATVVANAKFALVRIGAAAVLGLCQVQGAYDTKSRVEEILVRIGRAAVPELRRALASTDPDVRESAASALGVIDRQDAAAAVPELRQALGDPDPGVKKSAARALGWIGDMAQAAVPELRQALGDLDADVRRYAADALTEIGPEAILKLHGIAEGERQIGPDAVVQKPPDLVRFLGKVSARDHEALMTLSLIGDICERETTIEFRQKIIAIKMGKEPSTISGYLERLQEMFDRYFEQCHSLPHELLFERAPANPPVVKPRGRMAYQIARAYRDWFQGN